MDDPNNPVEIISRIILWLYLALQSVVYEYLYPFIGWWWRTTPESWPDHWRAGLMLAEFFVFVALWRRVPQWLRKYLNKGTLFGSARWANLREIRKAGLLKRGGRFLGRFQGRKLFLHGEGHTLTIAAQGGGKTTGIIIPTLLERNSGPVIVTDPKGAITAQTRKIREVAGRVVILNPWREELARDPSFGLDLGDDGFNPLQAVTPDHDGLTAARMLAGLLLPNIPGRENYFETEARGLLEWACMALVLVSPDKRTLPALHRLLYDYAAFLKFLETVAKGRVQGFGMESLQLGAKRFYGIHQAHAGQMSGIVGTASTALQIYGADTRLGAHVSRDGFKLADLKTPFNLTVYVICPPDHLVSDDRKWLNLVLAMICQQIGKPGAAVETVLLMDEFPALGFLPNLMGALEQFREAGLRAHLIAQNPGQIINIYGNEGMRRLWGACENKQFFRITDPEQAASLSSWIGDRQATSSTRNPRGEYSETQVGVPLIRPDELSRLPANRQIILRPGMRPIAAEVYPYFKDRAWRKEVAPNPYRKG